MTGDDAKPLNADEFIDRVLLDGRYVRESIDDPETVASKLGVLLAAGAADEVKTSGMEILGKHAPPHGVISRCGAWIFESGEWRKPSDPSADPAG